MGHAGGDLHGARSVPSDDRDVLFSTVCECRLDDGTIVQFRPIGLTDVPACESMLCSCSRKSLYSRYERIITSTPRELAEELCGDRAEGNLTVVAVVPDANTPIAGVAQLISDPNLEAAEYAVLVADPWQGRGLGGALTSFCLRAAEDLGIGRVIAEFLPDNMRMIRILEIRHFSLHRDLQERVVCGQKLIRHTGSERESLGTSSDSEHD